MREKKNLYSLDYFAADEQAHYAQVVVTPKLQFYTLHCFNRTE